MLSVNPPHQLLNARPNLYETVLWHVDHVNSVLHKYIPSVSVSVYVYHIIDRQRLGKKKRYSGNE
jgi:hypothetical protein